MQAWIDWLIAFSSWASLFLKQTAQVVRNEFVWIAQCLVNLCEWLRDWISYTLDKMNYNLTWAYNCYVGIWTNTLRPALDWLAGALERTDYVFARLRLGLHDIVRNLIDWGIRGAVQAADFSVSALRAVLDKLMTIGSMQAAMATAVADGLYRLEVRGVTAVLALRDKQNEAIAWLNHAFIPEGTLGEEIAGVTAAAFQGAIVRAVLQAGISADPGKLAGELAERFVARSPAAALEAFASDAIAQSDDFRQALARFGAGV